MIIRCGPFGLRGYGGHSHRDQFSFELYDREAIIIDPGIYAYNPSAEERNKFQSTKYHNTVMVDETEQLKLWNTVPPPRYPELDVKKNPEIIQWKIGDDEIVFEGEHYFYTALRDPVIHRRKIVFSKHQRTWLIEDTLSGEGEHLFDWYFHFADGVKVSVEGQSVKFVGKKVIGKLEPENWRGESPVILDGFVAPSYGVKLPASVVQYRLSAGGLVKTELRILIQSI